MTTKFSNIKIQKWICDFANTQGGTIFVGIKDYSKMRYAVYQEVN